MTVIDYSKWLLSKLPGLPLESVLSLRALETEVAVEFRQGLGPELNAVYEALPTLDVAASDLGRTVTAQLSVPLTSSAREHLRSTLMRLSPWRKGPFQIGDVRIDAEWRSDWKWNRVSPHLPGLAGRRILDVGCGNGYYLYRLAAERPQVVAGIDPYARYLFQFAALQKYMQVDNLSFLPVALDRLPPMDQYFDVVICMGVLYHQRSPLDVLTQLHSYLQPGGTIVMETLTIAGDDRVALFPQERYARMRNCFFLPTSVCLQGWLERAGFRNVRIVDETITSVEEQRSTEWMTFDSLRDFLDPADSTKTVEGYPAPRRTIALAER